MKGKIESIQEVTNYGVGGAAPLDGKGGARLGFSGMVSMLSGGFDMDGYEVKTTDHRYLVLIDNGQSCCESWGYLSTEDNLQEFVGADLLDVELTDTSLKTEPIEELEYIDEGGVQFVTFKTSRGDFQLAVYNGHNGYYGHGIIVAEDDTVLLSDTL